MSNMLRLFNHHKKIVLSSGLLSFLVFLIIISGWNILPYSAQADPPIEITIQDANLNTCLHTALSIPAMTPITDIDAQGLTSLTCNDMFIANLTGLEYFTSLALLDLRYNSITNIEQLNSLPNVDTLYLLGNPISNLAPLTGMNSLVVLQVGGSELSTVEALSGLFNLNYLSITWSNVSDISPLSSLSNLTQLMLFNNAITTISPLTNALVQLRLDGNEIIDINPLNNLSSLELLNLSDNNIVEINNLSYLSSLTTLDLGYNEIEDINSLEGLSSFSWLSIRNNNISDLSPLKNNLGLNTDDYLDISNNPLNSYTDIQALLERNITVDYNQACGNGEITVPEECDDGNNTSGDSCSNICLIESPPATPTDITTNAGNGLITLSWTASAGAVKYYIYQKNGETYPFLAEIEDTTYEVHNLTNGLEVFFKVSAVNSNNNESPLSAAVSGTPIAVNIAPRRNYATDFPTTFPAETIEKDTITKNDVPLVPEIKKIETLTKKPTTEKLVTPEPRTTIENIKTEVTLTEAQPVKPPKRSLEKESTALKNFVDLTKSIPQSDETWKAIDFLAYGSTAATKIMTEKQRRDRLSDYKLIYDKLPQTENDWLNLAKIIEGQTPTRILSRETEANKFYFKIFNKLVDRQKSTDLEFIDTIAYLKQVSSRDLEKEKIGLTKFVKTFKRLPLDSLNWSIVRAIAYFGSN